MTAGRERGHVMHNGHNRYTQRRRQSIFQLPVASSSRSLSLGAITSGGVVAPHNRVSQRHDLNHEPAVRADNGKAPHLPPLGWKRSHHPAGDPETREMPPTSTKSREKRKIRPRVVSLVEPLRSPPPPPITAPSLKSLGKSAHSSTCGETSGRATAVDVVIDTNEPAGITFQWIKTRTTEGLAVVDVVEGSLAARHGGVASGMLLVGINGRAVVGLDRDETMQAMQNIAGQPRALSLAWVADTASRAPSNNPATEVCGTTTSGRQVEDVSTQRQSKVIPSKSGMDATIGTLHAWQDPSLPRLSPATPSVSWSRPVSSSSASETLAAVSQSDGDRCTIGHSRPSPSDASCGQLKSCSTAIFSSDGDGEAGSLTNSVGISHTRLDFAVANNDVRVCGGDEAESSNRSAFSRLQRSPQQQQAKILALRFVGSQGSASLFDRDHILGVKKRDIEFVMSGGPCSERQRANSRRSLGELARDWRNDPCSTPARRRRLINDVCKVIVWSYTHASAVRVAEFRRQEALAVKIQSTARMRAARTKFAEKISLRRASAASRLQLAWLAYCARKRARVIRDERDRVRRAEEVANEQRLARAREDTRRRQQEAARAEREEEERRQRRRCRLQLATLLQRRFRRMQRELNVAKAAFAIQTAFRIHREKIRHKEAAAAADARKAQQRNAQVAVSCRIIQIAWRRYRSERKASQPDEVALTVPPKKYDKLEENTVLERDGNQPSRPAEKSAPNSKRSRQLGNDRAGATAWEGWASQTSALEMETVRGRGESDEAVDVSGADRRPWTAAAADELTPMPLSSPTSRAVTRPPAGMMAVRVRIGGEETSLVTPIVVTETDRTEQGDVSGPGKGDLRVITGSTAKQQGVLVLGKHPEITEDIAPGAAIPAGQQATPAPDTPLPPSKPSSSSGEEPTAEMEMAVEVATARLKADLSPMTMPPVAKLSSEQIDPLTTTMGSREMSKTVVDADDLTMVSGEPTNTSSPLPPPPAINVGQRDAPPHVEAESAKPVSAASHNKGDSSPTEVVNAVDNFMEDSQVYLGCSVCGVKYLVEAVEARLPASSKGQPMPEVLYLCTTCGGTLRQGEDGRWRRRRRPSSAPAASRRRRNEVSDRSAYRQNCTGAPGRELQHGSAGNGDRGTRRAGDVEEHQHGTADIVDDHARRGERIVKLRYAHCASRIQNAYQDFRHRQYLRDWAMGVLRRWLVCRVNARRRSRLCLLRRQAVISLQCAYRARVARARVRALSEARLRLWVDRSAALHGPTIAQRQQGRMCRHSPVSEELWRQRLGHVPDDEPKKHAVAAQGLGHEFSAAALATSATTAAGEAHCDDAVGSSRVSSGREARHRGRVSNRRGLAEALAPLMGIPPPGCPGALDVDWGTWGGQLELVFPPRAPSLPTSG